MAIDWRNPTHPERLAYQAKSAPFNVAMPLAPPEHAHTDLSRPNWWKSPEGRAVWLKYIQEREIKRLQCWIEHGLHPVYDSFEDAMADYYPDFSWNPKNFKEDVHTILSNQEWQILAGRLKEVRGFDLVADMQLALDQSDE